MPVRRLVSALAGVLVIGAVTVAPTTPAVAASPVAESDQFSILENETLLIPFDQLLQNDYDLDDDTLSVTGVQGAVNGQLTFETGRVIFRPTLDFHGAAQFQYLVSDGDVTELGLVQIDIADAPDCGHLTGALDGAAIVSGSWPRCADDSSTLDAHAEQSLIPTALPEINGSVALMTTGLAASAATPGGPDTGEVWGSVGVTEGHGLARDVSTYKLTVDVPDDKNCLSFDYVIGSDEFVPEPGFSPAADGFVAQLDSDDWSQSGSGADGLGGQDAFVVDSLGTGSPLLAPAQWTGDPNGTGYAGLTGLRTATVGVTPGVHHLYLSVFDGPLSANADAEVDTGVFLDNLRLHADEHGCASRINALPTAVNDSLLAYVDTSNPLALTANDTDPDGNSLQAVAITVAPEHGTATCAHGSCRYTPAPGYTGPDTLTYRMTDGRGGYDTATAEIEVVANPVAGIDPTGMTSTSVSAVVTRLSGDLAVGEQIQLLVGPTEATQVVVDTDTSDAAGLVQLSHTPTQAGTFLVSLRSVSNPDVLVPLGSVSYDPDPVASVTVEGPQFVRCDGSASYQVRAKRQSGAPVTTGQVALEASWLPDPTTNTVFSTGEFSAAGVATVVFTPGTCGPFEVTFSRGSASLVRTVVATPSVVTAVGITAPRTVVWPAVPTVKGTLTGTDVDLTTALTELRRGPTNPPVPVLAGGLVPTTAGAVSRVLPRPSARAFYRWWVPAYARGSATVAIDVRPLVSMAARKSARKVVVTGRTTPARAGTPVLLQRRIGTGAWRTVARTRTRTATLALTVAAGASYRFVVKATRKGASYRVLIPADAGRVPATSAVRKVR
ncbi:tandem-95 repeat protein [Nocardioides marmoriginsengisoli]|uniref:Tandem-95 repeat protein n=1 Tax=Nocardioides marmoriginsengisoli TaxID=661483 RepID=A0A3N0CEM8_9ACTN|nr:Ig-like domain-containing protein [Nocardioides marmoriginsengisoli]RNL61902.1 tandem-95 repeat protein [Nocardioides marmoriginsengisoli]